MIATKVLLLIGMAFSATTVTANPVTKTCDNVKCPVRCEMINGSPTCVGPPAEYAASANALSPESGSYPPVQGQKCGVTTCGLGEECCNESCGVCVPIGGSCAQVMCEPAGKQCGPNVCSGKTPHCCNESCGICTADDGFCTQQLCNRGFTPSESKRNAEADKIKLDGQKCGKATCPEGMSCCNSSCGICVKPGGACTQQFCQTEVSSFPVSEVA